MSSSFVSESVYDLVHSTHSISSVLAAQSKSSHSQSVTNTTPQSVADTLYPHAKHPKRVANIRVCEHTNLQEVTKEDLDRVAQCGRFTSRPSDLFLKMYGVVLRTYDIDPLANLVSPPLAAATGVIPLSILSVIPDIMRHYAECIVRAEKEVFFATNYWESSAASNVIADALRELSRRAGGRGERVVVKVMYDRGNIKQLCDPHQIVPVSEYTGPAVRLPHPQEIPNVDLEVCNYHQPLLGTFHAKYAVIDRKIALISSNNTQDRVNMEMMSHIEGPIVDAFYEMALLSWAGAFHPPLPLLAHPSPYSSSSSSAEPDSELTEGRNEREMGYVFGGEHPCLGYVYEEMERDCLGAGVGKGKMGKTLTKEAKLARITRRLNTTLQPDTKPTLVLSQLETPKCGPMASAIIDESDDYLEGEVDLDTFNPYIIHAPHAPCAMAMVNRRPSGGVDYKDTNCPQDVAWLAGLGWARERVFIQTPTFNAPPVVEAVLAAVRRGVEVVLYIDLGYNDGGEALPFQGGTNEVVVKKMFAELEKDKEKRGKLRVFWYTAKDMCRPVNASRKMRNCHVKLMIVDGQVGIMGNGNQDSQSWFHSQEANVMVDSEEICKEWEDAIRANQNTHIFGRVDERDGIWRDPKDGSLLEDAGSTRAGGIGAVAKGLVDAVRRVQ